MLRSKSKFMPIAAFTLFAACLSIPAVSPTLQIINANEKLTCNITEPFFRYVFNSTGSADVLLEYPEGFAPNYIMQTTAFTFTSATPSQNNTVLDFTLSNGAVGTITETPQACQNVQGTYDDYTIEFTNFGSRGNTNAASLSPSRSECCVKSPI